MHTVKTCIACLLLIAVLHVRNLIHYSNKCQLFFTCEQPAAVKGALYGMQLVKRVNNDTMKRLTLK